MTNPINGHDTVAEVQAAEQQKDNFQLITSTDEFMFLLKNWHDYRLKVLRHLAAIPEGVSVGLENEPEKLLSGDFHQGFILGMKLAIAELRELPFKTVEKPAETFLVEANPNGTPN